MIVSCSTSAFKTDLAGALAEIHRLGFRHVDLLSIKQWDHVQAGALAENFEAEKGRIAGLLAQNQLHAVAMNIALGHTYDRTPAVVEERLRHLTALCRFMNAVGVKTASFYPGYKTDRAWDEVLNDAAAGIREMLAVTSKAGITFAVELHAMTPFETVEQGTRLLAAVPELKVAYDPSHFAMQGLDLKATEAFLDRTVHVHLRDAAAGQMQAPFGQGTVDFKWLAGALKKRNYQGAWSIEYLPGIEGGAEANVTALRDWLVSQGE